MCFHPCEVTMWNDSVCKYRKRCGLWCTHPSSKNRRDKKDWMPYFISSYNVHKWKELTTKWCRLAKLQYGTTHLQRFFFFSYTHISGNYLILFSICPYFFFLLSVSLGRSCLALLISQLSHDTKWIQSVCSRLIVSPIYFLWCKLKSFHWCTLADTQVKYGHEYL